MIRVKALPQPALDIVFVVIKFIAKDLTQCFFLRDYLKHSDDNNEQWQDQQWCQASK